MWHSLVLEEVLAYNAVDVVANGAGVILAQVQLSQVTVGATIKVDWLTLGQGVPSTSDIGMQLAAVQTPNPWAIGCALQGNLSIVDGIVDGNGVVRRGGSTFATVFYSAKNVVTLAIQAFSTNGDTTFAALGTQMRVQVLGRG